MEVKIGVRNSGRELVLESSQTSDAVSAAVAAAVADGGVLTLLDDKGRTIVVPVDSLGYVEIGASEVRKVGFGTS